MMVILLKINPWQATDSQNIHKKYHWSNKWDNQQFLVSHKSKNLLMNHNKYWKI
jgi:hypothetical protein